MADPLLKRALRQGPTRPLYLWLAGSWRRLRRLFIYPATARVGATDPDLYWQGKTLRKPEEPVHLAPETRQDLHQPGG